MGCLAAGATAAGAESIVLPKPDASTGEVSDDTMLAFLFHYRYTVVPIPEDWNATGVRVASVAPTAGLVPAPVWAQPGVLEPSGGSETLLQAGPSGTQAVPEPATLLLLGIGAVGALVGRRRLA